MAGDANGYEMMSTDSEKKREDMKKSAARISLGVFIIAFVPTAFMPATAGSLLPIAIFSCFPALVIVGVGKGKMRITGAICLALAIYFTVNEYSLGKNNSFRERAKKAQQLQSK